MGSTAALTIVGGGLAGLTAAISSAEHGAAVTLHEAHSTLGGRARSTPAPYIANDGTHAFYDGPPWRWLQARNLAGPTERLTAKQQTAVRLRQQRLMHRLGRIPPAEAEAEYYDQLDASQPAGSQNPEGA